MKPTEKQIQDAKAVLSSAGFLQIYWTEEDIKSSFEEMEIECSKRDIEAVREKLEHSHDATIGINWEVIRNTVRFYLEEN